MPNDARPWGKTVQQSSCETGPLLRVMCHNTRSECQAVRHNCVTQHTPLTSPVLLTKVREPPDVAEAHAEPEHGEEELDGAVPGHPLGGATLRVPLDVGKLHHLCVAGKKMTNDF